MHRRVSFDDEGVQGRGVGEVSLDFDGLGVHLWRLRILYYEVIDNVKDTSDRWGRNNWFPGW